MLFNARLLQAENLIQRKDFSAARYVLRQLVAQHDDINVQRAAAVKIIEQFFFEDFRAATEVLANCTRGAKPDPEALRLYAFGSFALENIEESIRAAREALKYLPEDWMNMKTLGMANLVAARPV